MLPLLGISLLVVFPAGASLVPGGTFTFYVNDDDLNTSHAGIDEISTVGLLECMINSVVISCPQKIIETSVDSGVFVGTISIPDIINGKHLKQGDTLVIKYTDQSDASGNVNTSARSISVVKSGAELGVSTKSVRIGQKFQVKIYDPDFNLDSREADNIPLNLVEFRGSNGIRTTLANKVFDAQTPALRETGDNTNLFVVTIKIPKEIDGKRLKIGSTAQLRLTDTTSPAGTIETIKMNIRIGTK
jgi:hypothetical protein